MNTATPTFPQMQHFFRLVEEGKITAELFQSFLENPDKFFVDNGFAVSIDYSKSLVDMIEAGKYDWKNEDITPEHFPIKGKGTADVKLRLIHFGRDITTAAATAEIEARGFELAKIEHLLAFGAKYPEKQREFPIIALGSAWVYPGGHRGVPCLDEDGSVRGLCLGWGGPSSEWGGSCRGLVVVVSK